MNTPETEAVDEMETPVEITQSEMDSSRYSYDLPQNNAVKANESEDAAVKSQGEYADKPGGNNTDVSDAPEEDSQSQIPGDPRPPNALQPPTKTQY